MAKRTLNLDPRYTLALNRIEACRKNREILLDLSGLGLTTVPAEIGQLTALTTLYLHENQLTTLRVEIGQLKALRVLSLSKNQLETLPAEIGQLKALTTLYLQTNRLKTLPVDIGHLTALTTLSLQENQLTAVPAEIGHLTALTTLYLHANQLTTIPVDIGHLTALTTLSLQENQLTAVPAEIGYLTALTKLYLATNQLTMLPAEIGNLTGLTVLTLSNNQLTTLPVEIGDLTALTTVTLRNNRLTTLPVEIGHLSALRELFLHSNPGLGIPDFVLGPDIDTVQGREGKLQEPAARPSDILYFYFSSRLGASEGTLRPLQEIKVMLVGRGGAGKTSLRRYFLGQKHDPSEAETQGIALDSFTPLSHKQIIKVHLWDFAGQEITHALHRFFLTEGCVYILVLDPRSNTEMFDAFYWLNLLDRYAGDSPVILALNRQDARIGGYDVDRHLLKERFPHIQDFIPTNCKTRDGCDDLRTALLTTIEHMSPSEPPKLNVPNSWLKIKQECFKLGYLGTSHSSERITDSVDPSKQTPARVEQRSHLTLEQFRQICRHHGEMTAESQESLARLLHRLGAVLHFVDDPRLRDTSVLNPHWVTDGVYRLLRYKDRPNSDGILTRDHLRWALPLETEESARFLLRLMERFEMCFSLDEEDGKPATRWLIPGALNQFQPASIGPEWQEVGSVRLRYVYDPMPEGVLPRFIVMTYLLSEDANQRWRNGVVLREGQAKALVRRGEKVNHVEIIAFGPEAERLRLLQIIQGNMDRINMDVPDPKPFLEQEIYGLPDTFKRVTELEGAETAKTRVVVDSSQGQALIEPTRQLNRVSEPESRDPGREPLYAFLSYSQADKRIKDIFVVNLNVMKSKRLITPWHDGLIETGMLWRKEIESKLDTMDLFVGLLTNHFVASDFIQTVELKAARAKSMLQGKEFLFVLILVDDIPLDGLDLGEYQLLKPGGKSVSKHKSRKEGFNVAQWELEKLVVKRQASMKAARQERSHSVTPMTSEIREAGITLLSQGDTVCDNPTNSITHGSIIGRNVINSQAVQTLTNCINMVQQQAPGERKTLLETLNRDVKQLLASLPEDKKDEAPQVAENLEMLVKQATSEKPNRKWYSVSAEGLLDAATWVKDFSGKIGGTVLNLGKLLWGDFQLPGTK